jgi:hypothetical protein
MTFDSFVKKPDVLIEPSGRVSIFVGSSYKTMDRYTAIAFFELLGAALGLFRGGGEVNEDELVLAIRAFGRGYSTRRMSGRVQGRIAAGVLAALEADRRCRRPDSKERG